MDESDAGPHKRMPHRPAEQSSEEPARVDHVSVFEVNLEIREYDIDRFLMNLDSQGLQEGPWIRIMIAREINDAGPAFDDFGKRSEHGKVCVVDGALVAEPKVEEIAYEIDRLSLTAQRFENVDEALCTGAVRSCDMYVAKEVGWSRHPPRDFRN